MVAIRRVSLIVALIGLAGCSSSGPQRAEVSGSVLLDGQAIDEGAIQFIPVEGNQGPSAGGVIKDGKYSITRAQGAVVGKNRVELRSFKFTGKKIQDPTGKPGVMTEERAQAFPPEYNDKSTVVKDIQSGSNKIDFDIKTKDSK